MTTTWPLPVINRFTASRCCRWKVQECEKDTRASLQRKFYEAAGADQIESAAKQAGLKSTYGVDCDQTKFSVEMPPTQLLKNTRLLIVLLLVTGCSTNIEISTDALMLNVGSNGQVIGLTDLSSNKNYIANGIDAPLLQLRVDGEYLAPVAAALSQDGQMITLEFPGDRMAALSVRAGRSYIRLEVVAIEPVDDVELVVWGPYPTILNAVIGETVGVVQGRINDQNFAIGLQSMNPKTLGGFPWSENDAMPQLDIFESGDFNDLNPAGKRGVLYRVEAAKPDTFGSTLQAFTRNRSFDRIIPNRGYTSYVAPAYDDGGVIGSSIALFGAPLDQVLSHRRH